MQTQHINVHKHTHLNVYLCRGSAVQPSVAIRPNSHIANSPADVYYVISCYTI